MTKDYEVVRLGSHDELANPGYAVLSAAVPSAQGHTLCFGASTEAAATVATSMKQHDAERTTSGGVDAIENVVENMHARFSV